MELLLNPKCKHAKYVTETKMSHVNMPELNSTQMVVKLVVKCQECGMPFTFQARQGFSTNEPTTNADETELLIPIEWPEKMELAHVDDDFDGRVNMFTSASYDQVH